MIKKDDIRMILDTIRLEWQSVSERDIAFAILCDTIFDKTLAYRLAYHKSEKDAENFYNTPRFKKLLAILEPFGVGMVTSSQMTREQNKSELLKLLSKVTELYENGKLDAKDAVKMETDIRVKLNDKFEMEESQKQKRIIVVPAKHDVVCPTTNRECNFWPSKPACCTHYGLIDPNADSDKKTNVEQENTDSNEQE
jgi:hypothetical protein